jgi:hypothetical protein
METPSKTITNSQRRCRGTAFAIGSALAMALATPAFAAGGPPSPTPPTAIATSSPTAVWETDTVTLDASASHTNPAGGALEYLWQQQAPGSPVLALSPDNKSVTATYIAPAVPLPSLTLGVTFRVKVNPDGTPSNSSLSAPVTTTVYASPGADAEPKDYHVYEGTLVTLMGSATRTQPGATFSYTWTAPAGITLSDIHAQNPTFTAPSVAPAGQVLTFTLVVTEHVAGLAHDQNSTPDSVTINVDNVNQPPSAIANTINDPYTIVSMADVSENTDPVTLYGFGTDPDNDLLTFSWTQVGGITVALSGDDTATPSFTAPDLTTQDHVDLVFQLIVNDGHLNSGPSTVTIRVNNTNDPPLAVPAATPSAALEGDTVTLDGSGSSDPNNDSLTYLWEQTGGTPVTLTPSGSNATFVAPAVSAGSITLDFQLTVGDGQLSDIKPVSVTVSHVNQTPVADAGLDKMVPELSNTCLDGSGSYDPDGNTDSLTYAWVQVPAVGEPIVALDNSTSSQPCFDTPNVGPGGVDLHFQLTVTDTHTASSSDTVLVHVNYANQPPTANAGDNQNANQGTTVHLDGLNSSDPDGNDLKFFWEQVGGPTVVNLTGADTASPTFTAPDVTCSGPHVVVMRLTVDDGYGGSDSGDVNIDVANVNHNPTADAGGNQSGISEGDTVNLHGFGDDADTEEVPSLMFQWAQVPQIGEPAVTLSPSSGKNVSFTAPTIGGGDPDASIDLHFSLTVSDGCGGSTTTGAITVNVANIPHAPVAVAQANPSSANEGGSTVQLDGSMSSDPDLDALTYTWEQTAGPAVTLVYSPGDTMHVMPSFVTPWVSAGTSLTFKLTVSDWPGSTSSAYVTVTVINSHTPPDASHARADVGVLWPPDHKMVQVHIIGLVNPNNDPITIDAVTQDEPTNGLGDGDTPIDAIINGDSVTLRAERSGNGNGRVYRICFTVHDPEQDAQGCVNVMVPKSKKTDVAIDSGQTHDSTH